MIEINSTIHEMKTGREYLESRTKRQLDLLVATPTRPAITLACQAASRSFGYNVHEDVRVGRGGNEVIVHKIQTLDSTGKPLNRMAERFRQLGIDELLQLDEIIAGDLSLIGRRRLIPNEYDALRSIAQSTNTGRELLSKWDDWVLPYKCGLLSSFALEGHSVGDAGIERRLTLDIQDYSNASLRNDVQIVTRSIRAIVKGSLTNGSLPIER